MNLDYRYLKAFQLVATHLNFSKAASELNIAQSAISRQIKLLEESLDQQLIVRSSKKVLLTEKGKELLEIINQFDQQTNKLFFQDEDQVIRVGILHGLLENWFIGIIENFNKSATNPITVKIGTPEKLLSRLQKGDVDVIFNTIAVDNDLISSLKLFDEQMLLISSTPIDLKEIHKQPWIIYDEHDHLMNLYKKRPTRIIQVASITAIIKMVKAGDGIAIVPDHTLKEEDKLYRYEVKGLKNGTIYMCGLNLKSWPKPLALLRDLVTNKLIYESL
jgi:DNA-binding transcriptional LysR family regulator